MTNVISNSNRDDKRRNLSITYSNPRTTNSLISDGKIKAKVKLNQHYLLSFAKNFRVSDRDI